MLLLEALTESQLIPTLVLNHIGMPDFSIVTLSPGGLISVYRPCIKTLSSITIVSMYLVLKTGSACTFVPLHFMKGMAGHLELLGVQEQLHKSQERPCYNLAQPFNQFLSIYCIPAH